MIELLEMKILGWIRATIVLYQTLVVRGHDIATKVIFPSCIVHNYILACHGSADNAKWVYFYIATQFTVRTPASWANLICT